MRSGAKFSRADVSELQAPDAAEQAFFDGDGFSAGLEGGLGGLRNCLNLGLSSVSFENDPISRHQPTRNAKINNRLPNQRDLFDCQYIILRTRRIIFR